jgi:biopolymer transport protein ExbD
VFFGLGNDACESGDVTMRLRNLRDFERPSIMIIPMIDIMFFLLVFFMMTSLSMVDLHSLGVQLPKASAAQAQPSAQYVVTLKQDGSLWLNGQLIQADELLASARTHQAQDNTFSVVLCADRGIDYGQVADVLDALKQAGIAHIGLAADKGGLP